MTETATRAVVAALTAAGQRVLFVGGCVRDTVLKHSIKDIDIATPDPPDAVMALLAAARIKAVPTGIEHGTVTAVMPERHFEITTLRRDVETFGRRARVAFTDDWEADAARRDFTMNALYLAPDGTLFDPTGGLADLASGRVRFIGEAATRIAEDHLRILRFFRFTAWYGREPPDRQDLAACGELAAKITALAGERIAGEVLRLLAAPEPVPILRLMEMHAVLGYALPEAGDFARLERLSMLEALHDCAEPLRRLAALLAYPAGARSVAQRLRLSTAEKTRVLAALAPGEALTTASDRTLRALVYGVGLECALDRLFLAHAADSSSDRNRLRAQMVAAVAWTAPRFPVKGGDLIARGIPRGPEVSRLLRVLENWWIEQDFAPDRGSILGQLDATRHAER
ncbi:MAG: CCA tRNA nucleotidyltransferase [Alphaproteobacteria bacterium]|nr:CCA tRNA nucleotidyltransferase [Alphaproteobacteria bacterium]